MRCLVNISRRQCDRLLAHLLPNPSTVEQAAFLFASVSNTRACIVLSVSEIYHVPSSDFQEQDEDYLELQEVSLETIIRKAHNSASAIIEVHSHPWSSGEEVRFSESDQRGLAQVVPHVMWRLPHRPYVALVVGHLGFDALVWHRRNERPTALSAVRVGLEWKRPTGNTLRERR